MEWHFKGIARNSSVSKTPFVAGDQVSCLIFKDIEVGEIARADVLPHEVALIELPGEILGRWTRVVKKPDGQTTTAHETVASAEDFFLSLYEHEQKSAQAETDALKHLLALMLERKRIIRALGKRQTRGSQSYMHVKTKQVIDVPIIEVSTDLMLKIQNTLGDIIL